MSTTIRDVAQRAGVGQGTVSRVLNGSSQVSPATRERVERAISELNYRPNLIAQSFASGRTEAVAVIAPFITRPSVVERLRGIERCEPCLILGRRLAREGLAHLAHA
jgi:DNA-binding LacI/PurR family transcriptional regulator